MEGSLQTKDVRRARNKAFCFFNNAAIAKLAWKIITDKDNWWVQIWRARNDTIFRGKNPSPRSIPAITAYDQNVGPDSDTQTVAMPSNMSTNMIRWTPPLSNWVKINFDGSVQNKAAAGGFVLRSDDGKPLVSAAFNSGTASVPLAKALEFRNSLLCAKEKGVLKVEVEGDSKLMIDIVNGVCDPPWRLLKVVKDIKLLSCNFESIRLKHVFREANFVANALANLGHKVEISRFWVECVSLEASLALVLIL
ncbi:hypothetical protein ACLB2K_056756 [Fragaria x ananassa]